MSIGESRLAWSMRRTQCSDDAGSSKRVLLSVNCTSVHANSDSDGTCSSTMRRRRKRRRRRLRAGRGRPRVLRAGCGWECAHCDPRLSSSTFPSSPAPPTCTTRLHAPLSPSHPRERHKPPSHTHMARTATAPHSHTAHELWTSVVTSRPLSISGPFESAPCRQSTQHLRGPDPCPLCRQKQITV